MDYKDEIGVILVNLSPHVVRVTAGDKIAQGVISKVEDGSGEMFPIEVVEELTGEDRGGGFGSTDKKK